MTLNELLKASNIDCVLADPAIGSLCYDSRQAEPGALFFALPGTKADGAQFARQASERGAAAIVAQSPVEAAGCPVVLVPDARAAMADVAAAFFKHPDRTLKCVGITGTNGKTTTAFLAKHLLDAAGQRCGLIGTVKYLIGDEEIPASRTTPESVDLQRMLLQQCDAGGRAMAMEVSSHAAVQHRARGVAFDAAIFTNLTQDHLDYHRTMDAYFEAKATFFDAVAGQTPQHLVRPNAWQSAEALDGWTLTACVVAPGFSFDGFELAPPGWSPG